MIRHEVAEEAEPEERELREDRALGGDGRGDDVERADAIGGDDEGVAES
jgi:hypothetical protein